jgi:AraC family transcriptional regulator
MRPVTVSVQHQKYVHRAVNYMAQNLHRDLELEELAAVAGFSRFYFHRLFRAVMGEPVFHSLRRLRIEQAATQLASYADLSVRDIANECGIRSPTAFARAFREHFGLSAREWRAGGYWWYNGQRWEWRPRDARQNSSHTEEDDPAHRLIGDGYVKLAEAIRGKRFECLRDAQIVRLPSIHIAYMRQLGPYDVASMLSLWGRFVRWADRYRLLAPGSVGISMPRDNQHITAPAHVRTDVGMVVDPVFVPTDMLDVQELPGGDYLVADFSGRLDEEVLAYEYLWHHWMPAHYVDQNYGPVYRRFRLLDWKERVLSPDTVFDYQLCIPVKAHGAPLAKPEIVIEPMR